MSKHSQSQRADVYPNFHLDASHSIRNNVSSLLVTTSWIRFTDLFSWYISVFCHLFNNISGRFCRLNINWKYGSNKLVSEWMWENEAILHLFGWLEYIRYRMNKQKSAFCEQLKWRQGDGVQDIIAISPPSPSVHVENHAYFIHSCHGR